MECWRIREFFLTNKNNYATHQRRRRVFLNLRKQKEERKALCREPKPCRIAYLKENLFDIDNREGEFYFNSHEGYALQSELELHIEKLKSLEPDLFKGTEFMSYIEYGEETWSDQEGYGIEYQSNKWAERFLENFQNV